MEGGKLGWQGCARVSGAGLCGCWVGNGAKVQRPRLRLIQVSWVPSRVRVSVRAEIKVLLGPGVRVLPGLRVRGRG